MSAMKGRERTFVGWTDGIKAGLRRVNAKIGSLHINERLADISERGPFSIAQDNFLFHDPKPQFIFQLQEPEQPDLRPRHPWR